MVKASVGTVPADGLFPTCRNTITDLWLPLIGYLTFFCGLLNLLVDSRAMEKLARFLSPIFHRIFPDLRKDHPAYGFMTLNFAANFLGLDSAATPFGLKAMESMQEDNPHEGPRDQQPDHVPLPACRGPHAAAHEHHRLPRGQGAANPADIMIPLIITSFVGHAGRAVLRGDQAAHQPLQPAGDALRARHQRHHRRADGLHHRPGRRAASSTSPTT